MESEPLDGLHKQKGVRKGPGGQDAEMPLWVPDP